MMIFNEGSRGLSFRRVGKCGREVATHGKAAWLMMYSVAEGPSVSYRETEYSDCDMQARSEGFSVGLLIWVLIRAPTLRTYQLPFRSVLAPDPNAKFLLKYPCLLVDLDDADAQIGSPSLHGAIIHPLVLAEVFCDRVVGSVPKYFI